MPEDKLANRKSVVFSRHYHKPSKDTFTIKPIKNLLKKYMRSDEIWIDPFAGENSPAQITNDLNENKPTQYHMHAKDFCEMMQGPYDGILFDPPYSLTQVKTCYDSIGVGLFKEDSQYFPYNVKRAISKKIKPGGLAITFGWNSQGFGKTLGFELIELMLVAHGASHNDTIVTVERKYRYEMFK